MDCAKLDACIQKWGSDKIAFVRVEVGHAPQNNGKT